MARATAANAGSDLLYKRVGEAIRRVRGGLRQTDLAVTIGIDQSTLSDYENAKANAPLHIIVAIEDACDVARGTVLVDAGLIDLDIEALLRNDPKLDEGGRDALASFYLYNRDKHRRS